MSVCIKDDWNISIERFRKWWNHKGIVLGSWVINQYVENENPLFKYNFPHRWIKEYHQTLMEQEYPGDTLPAANIEIGPGSLSLYLGAEPNYSNGTIWYKRGFSSLQDVPEIYFDDKNKWWIKTKSLLEKSISYGGKNYFIGMPDLAENWDVLASLIGTSELLMAMVENPGLVKKKLEQIFSAYKNVFQKIYDYIKVNTEMIFWAFSLWGEGRTAKVQCDGSAMFSREMFEDFVMPSLVKQCDWLDNSMYHLDGTQAIKHLDSILSIESLDAVEWTPQHGIESGADPRWYPMYKKILDSGKSIQLLITDISRIDELFKSLGANGIYLLVVDKTVDFKQLAQIAKNFGW